MMKVSSTIDGTDAQRPRQRGFLGLVERAGNLLPEPAMIFVG
jgi:p-aminobenzoyl-glutamate transporter AbgT